MSGIFNTARNLAGSVAATATSLVSGPKIPEVPEAPKAPSKEDTAETRNKAILEAQRRRGRASTILTGGDTLGEVPVARRRLLGG